jgi:hypothetical protein
VRLYGHSDEYREYAMTKSSAVLACAIFMVLAPVNALAQACDSLATIRWILGSWQAENDLILTQENWSQVSSSTYEGRGEVTRKPSGAKDGVETLRLVEMSGGIYYIAKVSHNDLPIAFRAVSCGDDAAVFENPRHDFPKQLVYRRKAVDGLVVEVSDGASGGFTLEFTRQQ